MRSNGLKRLGGLLAAAAGLLVPLLPTGAAQAGADEKVYPGFVCQESGTDTGAFNRSAYRITRTSFSGSGIVLCPIVRDTVGSSSTGYDDGGPIATARPTGFRAQVRTYRSGSVPSVRLTLYSRNYTGSSIGYQTKYAGIGHQNTELWAPSYANSGYYHLEAEMGANSGGGYAKLYSYRVFE